MGLINYQRKFIPKFSEIAEPLYKIMHTKGLDGRFEKKIDGAIDVLKKSTQKSTTRYPKKVYSTWEEDGIKSFHCICKIMMSDRGLIMPDFLKEFELHTDASDYGY